MDTHPPALGPRRYAILPFSKPTAGTNAGAGHSILTAGEPWSGHYEINPQVCARAGVCLTRPLDQSGGFRVCRATGCAGRHEVYALSFASNPYAFRAVC